MKPLLDEDIGAALSCCIDKPYKCGLCPLWHRRKCEQVLKINLALKLQGIVPLHEPKLGEQTASEPELSPEEKAVREILDWSSPRSYWVWRTATEVALEVGLSETNNRYVGRALVGLGYAKGNISKPRRKSRGMNLYLTPPVKEETPC
jgi:hypothetical protein